MGRKHYAWAHVISRCFRPAAGPHFFHPDAGRFGLGAFAITASAQDSKSVGKPNFPESLPGRGLAQHDFLYAGEAKTRDIYLVRGGQVVWEYHDPAGRGEISDAIQLSNGNILYAHQFGIKLINPEKLVLWSLELLLLAPCGPARQAVRTQ